MLVLAPSKLHGAATTEAAAVFEQLLAAHAPTASEPAPLFLRPAFEGLPAHPGFAVDALLHAAEATEVSSSVRASVQPRIEVKESAD